MNNIFSIGSNPSSHTPLLVPMHEDDEIRMEGVHSSQQFQICSYNSTSNPTNIFQNDPQNWQFFDPTNPQVTSNNQVLLPQNYVSQYQMQLPVIPNNDYSNQLGLHHSYHMYCPSRETSWAITQFFRSRERYYGFRNQPPRCQADGCKADLSRAKRYHRRHKVCELHSKASVVHLGEGIMQRFCQQCSRFQMLDEFDDAKKSCRRRLADHNRRRRKVKPNSSGPSSSATPFNTTEAEKKKHCNMLHLANAAIARKEEAQQVENSKTEDISTNFHANNLNHTTGGLQASNYNCTSDNGTDISVTPSEAQFKYIEALQNNCVLQLSQAMVELDFI